MKGKIGTVLIAMLMIAAIIPACVPTAGAEENQQQQQQQKPDLIVDDLYYAIASSGGVPNTGEGGQQGHDQQQQPNKKEYDLYALIHNQGTVGTGVGFTTMFFLDSYDNCVGDFEHDPLGPGGYDEATTNVYVEPDTEHLVIVYTDWFDDVDESNEENNEATAWIFFEDYEESS